MSPPADHQEAGTAGLFDQRLGRVPVDNRAVDIRIRGVRRYLGDRVPEDAHFLALDRCWLGSPA